MNTITADVETSPDLAYIHGQKWEPKVVQYKAYSEVLGFSIKELDGKQTTKCIADYKSGEKGLLKDLWSFFDKADLVIGWNSDRFDLPKINTRFAKYGLAPYSPLKSIDLIKTARTRFLLPSNSLDDFLHYFGLGSKLENERGLFIKCVEGDKKSFAKLKRYNAHDTLMTEKAFKFLRPWIKNLNIGIYFDKTVCPKCGSDKGFIRGGIYSNTTTQYQVWRCKVKTCRGQARATLNLRKEKGLPKPLVSI